MHKKREYVNIHWFLKISGNFGKFGICYYGAQYIKHIHCNARDYLQSYIKYVITLWHTVSQNPFEKDCTPIVQCNTNDSAHRRSFYIILHPFTSYTSLLLKSIQKFHNYISSEHINHLSGYCCMWKAIFDPRYLGAAAEVKACIVLFDITLFQCTSICNTSINTENPLHKIIQRFEE